MAQYTAYHRTGYGTRDPVLVLYRLLLGDRHILTDFPRGLYGFPDLVEHRAPQRMRVPFC